MRIIIFIILGFFTFCISCENTYNKHKCSSQVLEEYEGMNKRFYNNYMNDSLRDYKINQVLDYGDSVVYRSLFADYGLGAFRDQEMLCYSFVMAEKYNNSDGSFDIYAHFYFESDDSLFKNNNFINKIKHYYLIKSWLQGNINSDPSIRIEFGDDYDSIRVMNYYNKLKDNLILESIKY